MHKARIKQASRAYSMGLSLGEAASLTGANKTQLLRYIGSTKIHDQIRESRKKAIDRYNDLKKLLGE